MVNDVIRKTANIMAARQRNDVASETDKTIYEGIVLEVLCSLRDYLIEERGDPRSYGQGFHDPLGPKISMLDDLLRVTISAAPQ